jgi:hypothetical protein
MYSESVLQLAPILIREHKFLPEILDYMQLPVKFREKLKQAIIKSEQAAMQAAQEGIQTGGRGAPQSPQERQAKIQQLQANTQVQVAKAARIGSQQKRDEYRTILDAIFKTQQLNLERERQKLLAAQTGAQIKSTEKKGILDFAGTMLTQAMSDETKRQTAQMNQRAKMEAKQPSR